MPVTPKYSKPTPDALAAHLTPLQYEVTQENGTERSFQNTYWDNERAGIYVDIVSGEPLFSSLDKFDSGSGWPSFSKPLVAEHIVERSDHVLSMKRTEVRSKHGDSHLGHVFADGPQPSGLRYCINSAALRFVPAEKLQAEGYGAYAHHFGSSAATSAAKPEKAPDLASEVAVLAGGCFWGVEDLIRKLDGVLDTTVGYTGGDLENPTYEQVKTGRTGHAEAIRVAYDPSRLRYEDLLAFFFRLHDPTTENRQGNDSGTQYRSAIFIMSDAQRRVAEAVRARVNASGKWPTPVVTEIVEAGTFYPAEASHQDYLVRNPNGYTCHWVRN